MNKTQTPVSDLTVAQARQELLASLSPSQWRVILLMFSVLKNAWSTMVGNLDERQKMLLMRIGQDKTLNDTLVDIKTIGEGRGL
jgi:hypothetical protein